MTKKKSFEDSLKELENIVSKLESGELPLEKSLEEFEVGTRLYKECKDQLSIAEKKIALLTDSLKEEEL
ncbi:exodeoxyribonuclease VII small subunit [Bacteriovorax sp. PP10]|jgi:exodeoxyribonuclease VII small subunit|uniref:Exodeoxyribonuclease 7 small subunit n=1 Tax=Bacteriovorax antarcticus TaxID=3088717 RepID=A0ABU5VPH6_9BACT|nr:exodeoxyribonuclease VII small subunit [Bacteriovorax sp. PP10]MEA9354901.1 exodeoxyribonuclease VII small subunit [Bacteriovorax sp. PP10]